MHQTAPDTRKRMTDDAISLLAEIVESDDVSIFMTAIEGEPWTADFEDWARRARAVIEEARGRQVNPADAELIAALRRKPYDRAAREAADRLEELTQRRR